MEEMLGQIDIYIINDKLNTDIDNDILNEKLYELLVINSDSKFIKNVNIKDLQSLKKSLKKEIEDIFIKYYIF